MNLRSHSAVPHYSTMFGLAFLLVVFGGFWVGATSFLPRGLPRDIVTCGMAFVVAGGFLYGLLSRLRRVYAGVGDRMWPDVLMATVNLLLLLVAFAVVYYQYSTGEVKGGDFTGKSYIADTTVSPAEPVKTFWACLYYSVVTFTTLGYGDLQPRGVMRVMACLETFVGYLVLGILASVGSDFLQNWAKSLKEESDDAGGGLLDS